MADFPCSGIRRPFLFSSATRPAMHYIDHARRHAGAAFEAGVFFRALTAPFPKCLPGVFYRSMHAADGGMFPLPLLREVSRPAGSIMAAPHAEAEPSAPWQKPRPRIRDAGAVRPFRFTIFPRLFAGAFRGHGCHAGRPSCSARSTLRPEGTPRGPRTAKMPYFCFNTEKVNLSCGYRASSLIFMSAVMVSSFVWKS